MKFKTLSIISAGLILSSLIFPTLLKADPTPSYNHFEDYIILKATAKIDDNFSEHYLAARRIPLPHLENDPADINNQWHLVQRQGLRLAQIDKAASQIFQFLLYSPDVEVVTRVNNQNDSDYFIARRSIPHSKKWYQVVPHGPEGPDANFFTESAAGDTVINSEGNITINGYVLHNDGNLVKENITKKLTGLGQIVALSEFLGDYDVNNRSNIVLEETPNEIKVYKIDNEMAFDYATDSTYQKTAHSIEKRLADYLLTPEILNATWFQEEKLIMQKKIAIADLSDSSVIATALRGITENSCYDSIRWLDKKLMTPEGQDKVKFFITYIDSSDHEAYTPAALQKEIDDLDAVDTYQCSGDTLLQELRKRQQQLREEIGYQP